MHRFFVPKQVFQTDPLVLPPEVAKQITTVLHLKLGERVVLLDNQGSELEVELVTLGSKVALGKIVTTGPAPADPTPQVTLYLTLTQREKFEWALQKCTEAGVSAVMPVITSRSLTQSATEALAKYERWRKILQEAAEQSNRGRIPTLLEPLRFGQALAHARQNMELNLIAWEKENVTTLKQALAQQPAPVKIGVFIGPEGGFSSAEIELACQVGAVPVTLGRRILRMETAAVVAVALILFQLEET
jgi:16S rRNA (uracil1498-N3)-methyltransferase